MCQLTFPERSGGSNESRTSSNQLLLEKLGTFAKKLGMSRYLVFLIGALTSATQLNYPIFCFSAQGDYDCVKRCVAACGYAKEPELLERNCLSRLPSRCVIRARPHHAIDVSHDYCSRSDTWRFLIRPDPEVSTAVPSRVRLERVSLRLESDAFRWSNCNATQVWVVGQLKRNPTAAEIADCSLRNYSFGERFQPGEFTSPGRYDLDLTKFFVPKFVDTDIAREEFLFQVSPGRDNRNCFGTLTTAIFSTVQTAEYTGLDS
eukprot:Gregarina_sp_Poly_1__2251@NODE_15_length_23029_cov_81_474305_g13_i0_p11_GENE_NODE_15_length_23029_cov_81_474305_g13_i0NODE_15_length_23029_cov_81_474305_g13_i0_p11_ORF_typecomplete_len261_score19_37_NODE_15_length_23029_cov_81_474305_g13_i01112711909